MIDTKGLYPIVIGCTGGSGSRVLRNILTASPQVHMDQHVTRGSRDSLEYKTLFALEGVPLETLRPLIEGFMITILDQIPAGEEASLKYFGWKNPQNLLHIDVHFEIHPELRFLHLIRNPAALARGNLQNWVYQKKQSKGEIAPGTMPDEWILCRWVQKNLWVWRKYRDQARYLMVRYEDMISASETTVQTIFDWMGVTEFRMSEALAAIDPPEDAISRGRGVDVSIISEALHELGYVEAAHASSRS